MNVSVIVTSYNQKDYLIQTLDSILAQTVQPFEVIICDDCSSDGSQDLIWQYMARHPHMIKALFHKKNMGVTKNRNTGIKAAKGDFITTLDGDDLYLPEKLEKELQKAEESNASLIYSDVLYIDANGTETGIRYHNRVQLEGFLFESIATLKYPAPREVLISRKCIEEMGILDESLKINEDFEWIARFASRYEFAAVKEPLVKHRYHSKGLHRSDRLLLLTTLADVTEKMVRLCEEDLVNSDKNSANKIRSFLNLTRARIEAHKGNNKEAASYLMESIKQDWMRSSNYDLLMRLAIPWRFRKESRIPDPLMIGPLALPFYIARGIFQK